jgi:hypothetical protein
VRKEGLIPAFDGSEEDAKIIAGWESGFGNLGGKTAAYAALKRPLKAIGLRVGDRDGYPWIYQGTLAFDGLLTASGIPHTLQVISGGGHSLPPTWMEGDLVPFFSAVLEEGK